MTKISVFLAQTAAPAQPGMISFLFPVLMLGAVYFLFIAPQQKKQKQHQKMVEELKAGDEIVTSGGIYGVISSVKDDRFVVRIGDNNAKVEVGKAFVSAIVKKTDAA
jgi:preprotein translocase subunit YajC